MAVTSYLICANQRKQISVNFGEKRDGQKIINIVSKYIFNKIKKGFIKADSTNLPKINIFMIIELLKMADIMYLSYGKQKHLSKLKNIFQ